MYINFLDYHLVMYISTLFIINFAIVLNGSTEKDITSLQLNKCVFPPSN